MSIATQETTEVNIEVGDKAIFLGYRGTGEPYDMLDAGDFLTVTDIEEGNYPYSVKRDSDGAETNLLFASELRVLKPKFKVGDRIIGNDRANREQHGATGTVTGVVFRSYPVAEGFHDSWGSHYIGVDWDNADGEGNPYPYVWEGFVDAAPVEVERAFQIGEPVYVSGRLGRIVGKECVYGGYPFFTDHPDHFHIEFEDGKKDCAFARQMEHAVSVGDTVRAVCCGYESVGAVQAFDDSPWPVNVNSGVYAWSEVSVHVEPEPEPAFKVGDRVLWTNGTSLSDYEGTVISHEGGDEFRVDWGAFGTIIYPAKHLAPIDPEPAFSEGDLVTVSEGSFYHFGSEVDYLTGFSGPGKVLSGPDSDGDYQVELLNGYIQHVAGECLSIRIVTEAEPTFVPGDRVVVNCDTPIYGNGEPFCSSDYKGKTGTIVAEKYSYKLGDDDNMVVQWDTADYDFDLMHHSCLDLIEPEPEIPSLEKFGSLVLAGRDTDLSVQRDNVHNNGGIYIRLAGSDGRQEFDWFDRDATKLLHATLGKYLDETEGAAA